MSESGAASLLDNPASLYDDWKYGAGKNTSIVRSSSAIVSTAASALLVWILLRSRDGMNTTYHRVLLGLSVSDILFSLSVTTFGAVMPSELSYVVWNARGSRATCDVFGFVNALGAFSGLIYMCSLNLYYLAKVKFNKSDTYIVKKIEPWLHAVPTLYGLIFGIIFVVKQGINAHIDGVCGIENTYHPPHCDGHDDGYIPEGFQIPCGRGKSVEIIIYVTGLITVFLVPVTIGSSLWMIYMSVLTTERRIRRYGAGALHTTTNDAASTNVEGGDGDGGGAFSILSAVKRRLGGRASATSSNNQDSSQSRAVLQRAAAYSFAYFLTWTWGIVYAILSLAGVWPTDIPPPNWAIGYRYLLAFFSPLQGLWTFLVYMQPNVIKRKRSPDENISWFRAFADALWSAFTGGNNSAGRRRNRAGPGVPPSRTGTNATPASSPKGRSPPTTAGTIDQQGNWGRGVESVGLLAEVAEEEKREVQEYERSV